MISRVGKIALTALTLSAMLITSCSAAPKLSGELNETTTALAVTTLDTTPATTHETTLETTPETTIATTPETTTETVPQTTPETTPAPETAPNTTTAVPAPETAPPRTEVQTNAPSSITAPPSGSSKPWKETAYSAKLYVNTPCFSRIRAEEGAEELKEYKVNELLEVVAYTDTSYYKLKDGGYIHMDFMSVGKALVFTTSTSLSDAVTIPDKPPKDAGSGVGYYDPRKALAYAAENWDTGLGHCAAFGKACLEAGGIYGLSDIGATTLYNQLMGSGLGYGLKVPRREDGLIEAPKEAFPGDIMLFYCPYEKRMVHTLVYNGCTKEGYVKAYAHNFADDGSEPLTYIFHCPNGCGVLIDTLALYCFDRNPDVMRAPDNLPVIKAKVNGGSVSFNWTADFLYSDSYLIIKDKSGKEIHRARMGTDKQHSLNFYTKGEYSAYIEMHIGEEITVLSEGAGFKITKPAVKE